MTDRRHTAGVLAGRREALELTAVLVRRNAAAWRAAEAGRGRIKAAILWATTELWLSRLEALAVGIDEQVAATRAQESASASSPPAAKKAKKARR